MHNYQCKREIITIPSVMTENVCSFLLDLDAYAPRVGYNVTRRRRHIESEQIGTSILTDTNDHIDYTYYTLHRCCSQI